VEHQNSGRETLAEWDTETENITVDMEKMTVMTVVTEMGETIEETVVTETEETAKMEETAKTEKTAKTEETAKTEMAMAMEETFEETVVEKVTEETMAENIMEETVTAMEEMDAETVKRTEETGNFADSYQNRRNTRQTDSETILYML
jgi:hypothetical protein